MLHQEDLTLLLESAGEMAIEARNHVEPLSLVEMIAELHAVKTVRSKISAMDKHLKEMQDAMEARIMSAMRDSGQTIAGGDTHKASLKEKTRLQIGAGGIHQYKLEITALLESGALTQEDALSLFPARINDGEYRDRVVERGLSLPCVEEVVEEVLSLTKI